MAHDEDPVDELRSVGMTSGAALSRVAETLIRAAQDHKIRAAQQATQDAEEAQRRYDAQAQLAERFYREAIDKDLMTTPPRADQDALRHGARQWAEVDPGRFGPYSERLTTRFEELNQEASHREEAGQEQRTGEGQKVSKAGRADDLGVEGPGYDSAERREETGKEMKQAGVPEPQRQAKLTADHLNAQHPKTAARGGQERPKTATKGHSVEPARKRTKTLGRGR